jgi:trigger factor
VKITVEKVDDINTIISGTVENKIIEAKVARLKEEAKNAPNEAEVSTEKVLENALDNMDIDTFQRDAEGEMLKEFIEQGMKEANINVDDILGQPGFRKYETREEGIYLEVELAVSPVIDIDVDLDDIIPTYTRPMASLEEIDAKITEIAEQQSIFLAIDTPRAIVDGDVTIIDFEGFLDGEPFEGGKEAKFNLKVGSNSFIPGFEAQLIGMEYGETRSVLVTFPENYESELLAGKETEFKVTLHEIQEHKVFAVNDELARGILKDDKATLEVLKEKMADKVNAQELSNLYNEKLKPQLIKGLLSKFDFTLPNNVVEQEIDAKINDQAQRMSKEEHEAYKEDKTKFHELRVSLRQEAEDSIKCALIVEAIAKDRAVLADEQEVHSALYYQAMMTGQDAQELLQYYKDNNLMTSAKMGLTEDKLFGQMLGFDK